jgi:hypothetical protein
LALTALSDLQQPPQLGKLTVAASERAQLGPGVQPGRAGAQAGHPQRVDGALFDLDRRDLLQLEIAAHQLRGPLAHQHRARRRRRLQPGRQHRGVTERGVIHPQVITDRPHHHQATVDPDPDPHLRLRGDPQRGQHGVPGVVLMRDRRPEQRHEPIAEELVDRALIPVHLGQRHLEEPVDHPVELLRPQLGRQRARTDYVAEQHAHLLALTLDGAPRRQDLLTDIRRGVPGRSRGHFMPTFRAEPGPGRQRRATAGARDSQLRATMQAKARLVGSLLAASRAPHRRPPPSRPAPATCQTRPE